VFSDREGRLQLFVFEPGSRLASVGRGPSSDVVLDWDEQVSRRHARFEWVDAVWVLIDDGPSSNGTFINGQRVDGSRCVTDGDVLRFGTTTVTFREPRRERAAKANDAQAPPGVALSTTQRRILAALCRPYKGRSGFASPADDQRIAEELFLSVGEVGAHVQVLCAKLGIGEAAAAERRVRLVDAAFSTGLISERDL
jgi:pSer/pThr/pTyr-binding forkhead associated (FHA) protein